MSQILNFNPAPNGPGKVLAWSPAAKDGVGTARSLSSRVWYTVGNGIVNEVYYPDVDSPQIRDLQLIITDGRTFFHDAQQDFTHQCERIDCSPPGQESFPSQALRLTNRAKDQPYTVVQEILAEPQASCVLVRTTLEGDPAFLDTLKIYVLLAPHMAGYGAGNSAYVASTATGKRLVANRGNYWLALGADCGFGMTACGFVGVNDGWTDIVGNRRLPLWSYDSAVDGYIAVTAEIARGNKNQFVLALAFCLDEATPTTRTTPNEALVSVSEALSYPFDGPPNTYSHLQDFLKGWRDVIPPGFRLARDVTGDEQQLFKVSRNVLLTHEDKMSDGALVASLSIPWGETVDDLAAGYHMVWPRDMCQSAIGLLAAGEQDTPLRGLMFLAASQSADGSFHQKFFIDGQPWLPDAMQLDEYSHPILLAYHLSQSNLLKQFDPKPMVLAAAGAIIRNGPMTQQERWEENEGFSPSTLASNIAGLVCAADLALNKWGDPQTAQFLLEYADYLESNVDKWCVTTAGGLVPGYPTHYIRLLPTDVKGGVKNFSLTQDPNLAQIWISGRQYEARNIVDGGFLELVRYGIRDPKSQLVVDSVKVIDAVLRDPNVKVGICYHRYNNDEYGQGPNGEPWPENAGPTTGRPWPLLAGERGHYEIACGSPLADVTPYISSMEAYAGSRKLIPEQIWNQENRENPTFTNSGPTGSAMPLAWAHAEYIKLIRSAADGRVYDRLPPVAGRYVDRQRQPHPAPPSPPIEVWNLDHRPGQMKAGTRLRVPLAAPFRLRWTLDDWATFSDITATETKVGIYYVDLPTNAGQGGTSIQFTMFWLESQTWQGLPNFSIALMP